MTYANLFSGGVAYPDTLVGLDGSAVRKDHPIVDNFVVHHI